MFKKVCPLPFTAYGFGNSGDECTSYKNLLHHNKEKSLIQGSAWLRDIYLIRQESAEFFEWNFSYDDEIFLTMMTFFWSLLL